MGKLFARCTHPTPSWCNAGKGVIRTVGEEIDRLENEMKALVPGLK
jgi:hypothetical protein